MSEKIKTSLEKDVTLNYNATHNLAGVGPVSGIQNPSNTEMTEEVVIELPDNKMTKKMVVIKLEKVGIEFIDKDMIESFKEKDETLNIVLKNGAKIVLTEKDGAKIIDASGISYTFSKDGMICSSQDAATEISKVNSSIKMNDDIKKMLETAFEGSTSEEWNAFLQKIQNDFPLYESVVKTILEQYHGKEKEFQDKFGFSLYTLGEDGNVKLNYEALSVYLAKMVWSDYYGFTNLSNINQATIPLRPEAGNQLLTWMPDGTIGINSSNYPITSLDEWNGLITNFYGAGNLVGQCTWFASRRYFQTHGVSPVQNGNAGTWVANADPSRVSSTPQKHSVIVLGSGDIYGHVAFVEDVKYDAAGNLTSITISEANVGGNGNFTGPTIAHAKEWTRVKTYSSLDQYLQLNPGLFLRGFIV